MLEDKDELVLAAIQTAHTCVALDPNAKVLELGVNLGASRQNLKLMAPVHADEVQGAPRAMLSQEAKNGRQQISELGGSHLTGCHGKFTVANMAVASGVPIDGDVKRRVAKDHARSRPLHECRIRCGIRRVAAENPVSAQGPEIALFTYRRTNRKRRLEICRIRTTIGMSCDPFNPKINLADRETRNIQVKIKIQAGQILEDLS